MQETPLQEPRIARPPFNFKARMRKIAPLRERMILIGIVVIFTLIAGFWLYPFARAIYHQVRGNQYLDKVLEPIGGADSVTTYCLSDPLDDNTKQLAQRSRGQLERSLAFSPEIPHTQLQLGRINCLLGDLVAAIDSYITYTELRPENPLGYLELGFAYERECRNKFRIENKLKVNIASLTDILCPQPELHEKIVTTWKAAEVTTQNFVKVGEQARNENHYDEALDWFARAISFSPQNGKIWYEIGLVYEEIEWWESALAAYQRGLDAKLFIGKGISDIYYQMGKIYQTQANFLNLGKAKTAFETAISQDDFISKWEKADSHYRLGTVMRQIGDEPNKYISEFQQAISIYPNHALAHSWLGVAYYVAQSDFELAEKELLIAIEIEPSNKWGYFRLGEIYYDEDKTTKAIDMYREALKIDPDFTRAKRRLDELLADEQ